MRAKQSFEEALEFFSRGLYHRAISGFREAIGQDESTYAPLAQQFLQESIKLLAVKYISQELFPQALDLLTSGLEELPESTDLKICKAIVFHNTSKYAEALSLFQACLDNSPDVPAVRISTSITLLNMGFLDQAEKILSETTTLPPFDATIHLLLGTVHYRKQKYPVAETQLNRALELQKPFPEALLGLIALYVRQNRPAEAMTVLTDLLPFYRRRKHLLPVLAYLRHKLSLADDHPVVREYLSPSSAAPPTLNEINRWADNHFYEALPIDVLTLPFHDSEGELIRHFWFRSLLIQHYQQLLAGGSDQPDIHFRLGREFQRTKKHDLAIRHFRKCLAANPGFLPAKISLAFAHNELTERDKARELLEEIHHSFQKMPDLILRSSELQMDEPAVPVDEKALRDELRILQMAVRQNPHFADIHYNIGRIHYLLDQPEEALQYFEKACRLNPNFIRANIGQAVSLMQMQHIDDARAVLNQLSGNRRLYAKVTYTLAVLHQLEGRLDKARVLLLELTGMDNDFGQLAHELLQRLSVV
ncbi:MAG: tetratricopeptide repeat protein [Acidobacteria bacterium]|nr:tetratricopeptide repeat protein [Acidobacteriota bacterium]